MQIVGLGWIKISAICLALAATLSFVDAQRASAGGAIGNDEMSLSATREAGVPRQIVASNVAVSAHCPITGATGVGHGSTFESARAAAIRSCVGKGGVPSCCAKYTAKM